MRNWSLGAVGQLLQTTWAGVDESLNQRGEGKDLRCYRTNFLVVRYKDERDQSRCQAPEQALPFQRRGEEGT